MTGTAVREPAVTGGGSPLGRVTPDDLEALRVPLTGYCYRMLGAAADADDAVQETLIKAAGRLDRYDASRARLSTWVHAIATNVCLDLLRSSSRRAVPVDLGPAATGPADLGAPLPGERWVEPMPDARVLDPADQLVRHESVRLAFVAALQRLAPRQRAVLVLREVLAFSAQETAAMLQTTVPAVNSALQRARAVLAADPPTPVDAYDPADAGQQELLRRYVTAFEAHDVAALTAVLAEDATTSMPPFAWWLRGGATIAELVALSDACAGARLLPTRINGSPGFGQYRPAGDGDALQPFALVMVELRGGVIGDAVTFLGSDIRFAEFGLPAELPVDR